MKILGISGKKQSGKTTSGNFIVSIFMGNLGISQKIQIDSNGEIVISDLFGNTAYAGTFDISKNIGSNDFMIRKAIETLHQNVKLYSFADPLKQDICINLLGLTWDQCYGTDEHKNTKTNINWEDMPISDDRKKTGTGSMTARQVMEFVGTDIFRKIKKDIWVSSTLARIVKDNPKLAIITDCRFSDEISAIKKYGGKVIRLDRCKFQSNHESEITLDESNYDWSNFDFVIRNNTMNIYDQCIELQKIITEVMS